VPFGFSVMPAFNIVLTGVGTVLVVALAGAACKLRRTINQKILLLGVSIFFISLLVTLFYKPVFIGFAYDYLDHRMFFPDIGLLLVVYALVQPFLHQLNLRYALPALALAMAIFAFVNARNYKNKYTYYDNATRLNPQSGLAWINYGGELYADGRYDEAIDKFEHLVALFPDSPYFKVRIAEAYLSKKDTVDWFNQYRNIVKVHPTFTDAYYHIAGYYNFNGITDSAIYILTAAINADTNNAQNYFERGRTEFMKAHLVTAAQADFKKSIALDSTKFGPYFELGCTYVTQADYNNAYINFNKYVQLHPDGTGYFYRGQALCVLNRLDEGCKDLTTAAQMGVEPAAKMKEKFCK
jgi:tetratricopeptide (TPR) repeat protein